MKRGPGRRPPRLGSKFSSASPGCCCQPSLRLVGWLGNHVPFFHSARLTHHIPSSHQQTGGSRWAELKTPVSISGRKEGCSEEQIITASRCTSNIGWTNCYFHIPRWAMERQHKCEQKLSEAMVYCLNLEGFTHLCHAA